MKLIAKASIQVQKPIEEVFEGIVDPEKMTKYFISGSSGRLETDKELMWQFPEFPGEYPVNKIKIDKNRSISFVWDKETVVNIALEAYSGNNTVVKVTEDGKEYNEDNLQWVIRNTEGWANFLACMKAYLEYGIQLRRGAFDFMKQK